MTRLNGFKSSLFVGAALLAVVQPASAQQAAQAAKSDDVSEVLVVAQRQQYRGDIPLQELPQSVQVLEGALLKDLGITRFDDALELASGVARQNNFGGLWDAYAIRGFAGDENFPSGYLVNGFNGGRGYGGPRDSSNVEKIEVLKGPNSAVFGRGEPGGTVNIITKKPKFKTEGSASVSVGSYSNYRVEGDVTGPLTNWLAIRLNGAWEDADSFRDTIHTKKEVASPSALARLGQDTTLSYEMEYVHQKVPFDRGIVAINGQLGAVSRSTFLGEPGDGPTEVDVLGHQVQLQHNFTDEWSFLLGGGSRHTTFKGFSSDAELALGRQTLISTGNLLSRQRRYRTYETDNNSLRGEIAGRFNTGALVHHLIAGADWDKFEIDTVQLRFRPGAFTAGRPVTAANNAINVFNPVYGSTPTPTATLFNQFETQRAHGFYLNDQVDLTDKLKVRFGGRYDDYKQTLFFRATGTTTKQSFTKFSPQAGLVYTVTDEFSVYGGYGKGFRPNSGTDFRSNPFAPETTKSYEVGAKYTSGNGRITGNLALFTMTKNNILTADPVNAGFSMAVGEADSRGVEFDVTAKLDEGWMVSVNYAWTDAEVAKDFLDPNFAQPIRKGDPLLNVPKNQASLLLTKDLELLGNKLTLGGGATYVDERLGETATRFKLPSYTLVRLLATYEVTDALSVTFNVNNLFDETYYASSYAQLWVAPGAPRTYKASATYRF